MATQDFMHMIKGQKGLRSSLELKFMMKDQTEERDGSRLNPFLWHLTQGLFL